MIESNKFFLQLKKKKVNFFAGVPDSVLKATKNFFERKNKKNHIVTANEGLSVAACIGHHLATGEMACAYMQNSGLGNAINPLISIAHKKVYSIPLLLLIGWRGAPGVKDEPQHIVKGKVTRDLLDLLDIKYCILNKTKDLTKLKKLIEYGKKKQQPVACLVKKGTLIDTSKSKIKFKFVSNIKRIDFIETLLNQISHNTNIVSTTGYTSRELHQIRLNKNLKKGKDFYMVGGMGHSGMVALGSSLSSNKTTLCLDGDGSVIMHLGSLANIGLFGRRNFKHILFNNYAHESVGGQETNSQNINFEKLINALGYKKYFLIDTNKKIKTSLKKFLKSKGPSFLEVRVKMGSVKDLARPKKLITIKNNYLSKYYDKKN